MIAQFALTLALSLAQQAPIQSQRVAAREHARQAQEARLQASGCTKRALIQGSGNVWTCPEGVL